LVDLGLLLTSSEAMKSLPSNLLITRRSLVRVQPVSLDTVAQLVRASDELDFSLSSFIGYDMTSLLLIELSHVALL